MYYFDYQTHSPTSKEVLEEMKPYVENKWGGPNAFHDFGQDLLSPIKLAYQRLYELIHAPEEATLCFTGSGSEAVNHVIFGAYLEISRSSGRNHFISTKVDEAPAILSLERLDELGCSHTLAEVNEEGILSLDQLREAMTPRTLMLTLSWANGLTGTIQPIKEVAQLCKERGILLHVDATHVIGKLVIDVQDLEIDFLSFKGDSLFGPKGSGALYIKSGLKIAPFIVDGYPWMHSTCTNPPALIGLGKAAKLASEKIDQSSMHTSSLRYEFESKIKKELPETQVLFENSLRLPNISAIAFPGISSELLAYHLNQKKIYSTFGGGGFQQLHYLLKASGVSIDLQHAALSFSFSPFTKEEEVHEASAIIIEEVKKLRTYSKDL